MSDIDFTSMTKKQLEAYGRTVGIELDRRETKATLLASLVAHLDKAQESDVEVSELMIEEPEIVVVVPVVNPEIAAAKAMLAQKAKDSISLASRQSAKRAADIEHSIAEQSSRDARRMADHAKETVRQVEAAAEVLANKAAVISRMAEDAARRAASLSASVVTPRDEELARQAEDAARVLSARAVLAQRKSDESKDHAEEQTTATATFVEIAANAIKREAAAVTKRNRFL